MFFNLLSLPEFLLLFGTISGLVVTLYLLSRARRKQVVSTLRFWVHASQPVPSSRRRWIQQPWSLLLQLLSLALLLLALAQLKIGNRETAQRDHVLLLDSSSWMGARTANGQSILLDEAKRKARSFVRSLPPSDRVMVVRVEGLPSPATGMEKNRDKIERAIDETRPGASALNLDQALLFADQIRKLHNSKYGEIIYAGGVRVSESGKPVNPPRNLRVLEVAGPSENFGLVSIGARRTDTDPEQWNIFVAIHNYSGTARRVPITLAFGGAPAGSMLVDVRAGATETHTFQYRTKAAGWIEARLPVRDALLDDNRAILELPELKYVNVAVYTEHPEALRPVLAAHPQVRATFYPPAAYRANNNNAQVILADRFTPSPVPNVPIVFIQPPDGSPFRIRSTFSEPKNVTWHPVHAITSGLRSRDERVGSGEILAPARNDIVLADVEGSAIVVVRPEKHWVALGFDPVASDLKFDLSTPLLMANILRWVQSDAFRVAEVHGTPVGTVTATLEPGTAADPSQIRVLIDKQELPYTIVNNTVRFFAGSPGVVRVLAGDREQVFSLSLPEVGESDWSIPAGVRRGLPNGFGQAISRDLWQILAIIGAAGLVIEWLWFGRRRTMTGHVPSTVAASSGPEWRKAS